MPICITCSTPVKNLYTTYSKADDRSLGKGVRLTQCPNCKRFADKYVEHDYVVLFIDLVLIKPQVYRHLLFNRLWTPDDALDPSIVRLGILLILFDVYITWARIEQSNSTQTGPTLQHDSFSTAPIITQYLFFLTLNVLATVVQHGVIRGLARVLVKPGKHVVWESRDGNSNASPRIQNLGHLRSSSSTSKLGRAGQSPIQNEGSVGIGMSASTSALDESVSRTSPPTNNVQQLPAHHISANSHPQSDGSPVKDSRPAVLRRTKPGGQASPSAISTSLLVSSCTKLFPILLVIWPTSGSNQSPPTTLSSLAPFANRATSYIGWVVLLNNIEALLILLDCGYIVATTLAVAGFLSRWIVEGWLLSFVGLVREMEGPVGDVVSVWRWILGSR